jgi:putrescine transport system ATP-binding protein
VSIAPAATERGTPFLRICDLVKEFDGVKAVDGVSLDVHQGEIFALLGPSGCGKSTLLRVLAGFETPTSGEVVLDGQSLAGLPPYLRPINMMFQSYALFPHLSVWDNVAFGLKREGLPRHELAERVSALLALVQLSPLARRQPHQLSGGQQQRVALARSLAKRPRLLLLDEPLGALDKKLREETQVELVRIVHEVGVTCVLVTHDQEEAMGMASRMAVMHEGRLLQVGAPAEVYEGPATRFVAEFIGSANLMSGTVVGRNGGHGDIQCKDCMHRAIMGLEAVVGAAVTVAVRPEKIRLTRERPDGGVNQAGGRVRDRSYFGSFTVYHVALESGAVLEVSQSNADRGHKASVAVGDEVWASWGTSAPVVLTR